jgi:hypothetical protein
MKSNKGQLVCEHLENISLDALETHQDIIREYVKGRHGIYALYRNGRLYYVGLASDLRRRLKHHLHDRHAQTWDRFSVYLTADDRHLRDLESLVLKIASPTGNRQTGKFVNSRNVMPAFKQGIKNKHKKEIRSLFGLETIKVITKPTKSAPLKEDRKPVLAAYIKSPLKLRLTSKGKFYKASVKKDGSISYKGQIYNSPSLAGKAAIGRNVNGWTAWKYQRTPGEWVLLDNLRK